MQQKINCRIILGKLYAVPELKNALLASFFHTASSKGFSYHTYCPKTKDIWCQFQRDTNLYKPGKGYHEDVLKHAKPVYLKLTFAWQNAKCE